MSPKCKMHPQCIHNLSPRKEPCIPILFGDILFGGLFHRFVFYIFSCSNVLVMDSVQVPRVLSGWIW